MLPYHFAGTGDFDVVVHVDLPATGLKGQDQELVARYFFCGMEQFQVIIPLGIGIVCSTLGLLLTALLWFSRRSATAAQSHLDTIDNEVGGASH